MMLRPERRSAPPTAERSRSRVSLARTIVWIVATLVASRSSGFAENSFTVGRATAAPGELARVPLLLSTDVDAHGFVMVFEWDPGRLTGEALVPRAADGEILADADIVVTILEDNHMIYGVSLDADSVDCEKIPAGQDIEIGVAEFRCSPDAGEEEIAIELVDGKYAARDGLPLLENLLLHYARFITVDDADLVLRSGGVTCRASDDGGTAYACGGPLDANGIPTPLEGKIGDQVPVHFYYRAPSEGPDGPLPPIQGLSVAGAYDCNLTAMPESFSFADTVLAETEPEFVHFEADNRRSADDGDACEFTLGILIDATAPFDGRTLPAAEGFERLFTVDFEIGGDAFCGHCLPIRFLDGVNGNGDVPVKNLVSMEFESRAPELFHCEICVRGEPEFIRGDCNFSSANGSPVDIADAAAIVGFVFLEDAWKFDAPCEDACDANDDGRLDAADVVFVLEYLFVPERPEPPAPGPLAAGKDPTPDELDCAGGELDCF